MANEPVKQIIVDCPECGYGHQRDEGVEELVCQNCHKHSPVTSDMIRDE